MTSGVKVSGAWKSLAAASVKVAGAWKTATGYVKVAGAWKQWTPTGGGGGGGGVSSCTISGSMSASASTSTVTGPSASVNVPVGNTGTLVFRNVIGALRIRAGSGGFSVVSEESTKSFTNGLAITAQGTGMGIGDTFSADIYDQDTDTFIRPVTISRV